MSAWKVGETYPTKGGREARVDSVTEDAVHGWMEYGSVSWRHDGQCFTLTGSRIPAGRTAFFDLLPPTSEAPSTLIGEVSAVPVYWLPSGEAIIARGNVGPIPSLDLVPPSPPEAP
jgi:hypothetical protein